MKTKIAVEGAEFYAFHGYYPEEQLAGNLFIVDAEVFIDHIGSEDDEIMHTVNYEFIYSICKEEMLFPRKLIETVAIRIIKRLKNTFPEIISANVRISKIAPQLGGKTGKTTVEISL